MDTAGVTVRVVVRMGGGVVVGVGRVGSADVPATGGMRSLHTITTTIAITTTMTMMMTGAGVGMVKGTETKLRSAWSGC